MKVKICGLQTKADVKTVAANGGDMVGFVFAASKRRVTIEQAHELAKQLPSTIKKVGVFVNPTLAEVTAAASQVPLDLIQLHGTESEALIRAIKLPVIKAYPATDDRLAFTAWLKDTTADYILLDTPGDKFAGGSGKRFDWQKFKPLDFTDKKIIIAGGLTPENVREAVSIFQPYGVDVSSGVETNGQKNQQKIIAFLQNAKGV